MAREKTKKKGSAFWRFYRFILLLIVFALAAVFLYVRGVMIEYEKSQPDNYVVNLFKHAGKSDKALGQYLQENCFGENSDNAIYGDPAKRSADFYNTVAFSELESTLDLRNYDAEAPTYSVTVDGKPFASVRIKKGESKNKLGILNISKWSFDSIVLQNPEEEDSSVEFNENGKFDYTLVMPADFVLKVDGVEVKSFPNAEETVLPEFENMIFFPDVPKGQKITLKDLCFEPVVTVENNEGKEVTLTLENGVYYAEAAFAGGEEAEAIAANLGNIVDMGWTWSKFMTDDVGGYWHGLYTVLEKCRIMPGTDFYDKAERWAKSEDIRFVSDHNKIEMKNETVGNYIKYNEKLFSADVYFEKVVYLTNGNVRTDVFNNRMFFVYVDDATVPSPGWYWAEMLALQAAEPVEEAAAEETVPANEEN